MPNRRTFFATAASGLAWLVGIRPEKPRRQFARKYVVVTDVYPIDVEISEIHFRQDDDGKESFWTTTRVIQLPQIGGKYQ